MLLDPPRELDLLPDLRARRRRELDLREVALDGEDTPPGGRRADVDEQQLTLSKLRDLCLLLVV